MNISKYIVFKYILNLNLKTNLHERSDHLYRWDCHPHSCSRIPMHMHAHTRTHTHTHTFARACALSFTHTHTTEYWLLPSQRRHFYSELLSKVRLDANKQWNLPVRCIEREVREDDCNPNLAYRTARTVLQRCVLSPSTIALAIHPFYVLIWMALYPQHARARARACVRVSARECVCVLF